MRLYYPLTLLTFIMVVYTIERMIKPYISSDLLGIICMGIGVFVVSLALEQTGIMQKTVHPVLGVFFMILLFFGASQLW